MKDPSFTRREHLSSEEFIKMWSQCAFLINMDPIHAQPGWQAIHAASVGTINIGGLNDSHKNLYPTLATNDERVLEQEFKKIISDDEYRIYIEDVSDLQYYDYLYIYKKIYLVMPLFSGFNLLNCSTCSKYCFNWYFLY